VDFLPSCILVQALDCWLNSSFKICNVYGPYVNRCPFWDSLSGSNEFYSGNIILGGDLNFMLSVAKVWGQNPCQDLLESYFSNWMEKHNLIDLARRIFPILGAMGGKEHA
jgi:hypothetical protein